MLKTSRIPIAMLLLVALVGFGSPWGEVGHAQTSGGISRDYDDTYGVKHRVMRRPHLDVEVWVDKGEGSTYNPGEEITIYFQTSRDCYVVIYNIDTRGYVHLLYPVDARDDSYVEGERVYRIPDRFDDYDLTVEGPDGMEYVQAVASLEPVDLPNFPGEYWYEGEVYAYQLEGEDPFEFMAEVNAEIAPYEYASDVCIFSVEYPHPEWYYHPQVAYVDRPVDLYWGGAYFDYPWGVEVWIDGIFYGLTPITIPALVVGRHYVSYWFHGCWIWRDWCHIRRGHTFTVWADCHDRYWHVRERYVEKSYRAEKGKRRRGIDRSGGLVKPVRLTERGMVARAEAGRIEKDRGYTAEKPVKRKASKERLSASRITERSKAREIKKVIRSTEVRERQRPDNKASVFREKVKAGKVKPEAKALKKVKRTDKVSSPKKPSKAAQKIRKDTSSKPKPSKATMRSGEKRVTKSAGTRKPSSSKPAVKKPAKRRR